MAQNNFRMKHVTENRAGVFCNRPRVCHWQRKILASVRKVEGGKKVYSREDVGSLGCGVFIWGRQQCVASLLPPFFKLKIKEEGLKK